MAIVTQIIEILVSGLTGMASGIGRGLNQLAQSIFLAQSGENWILSQFGQLIIAFGAVALAVGLSRFVVNWLTSFGK